MGLFSLPPLPPSCPPLVPHDVISVSVLTPYLAPVISRFSHVALILGKMVHGLAKQQSQRLLKHVVRCYLRLSDNSRAREALRQCLPEPLKHQTFANCLKVKLPHHRPLPQCPPNLSRAGYAS